MNFETRKIMAGYHLRIMDLTKREGIQPGFIIIVPLTREQYEKIIIAQGADYICAGTENNFIYSVCLPHVF